MPWTDASSQGPGFEALADSRSPNFDCQGGRKGSPDLEAWLADSLCGAFIPMANCNLKSPTTSATSDLLRAPFLKLRTPHPGMDSRH